MDYSVKLYKNRKRNHRCEWRLEETCEFQTAHEAIDYLIEAKDLAKSNREMHIDWRMLQISRYTGSNYARLKTEVKTEALGVILCMRAAATFDLKGVPYTIWGHPPLNVAKSKYKCYGCGVVLTVENEMPRSGDCKKCHKKLTPSQKTFYENAIAQYVDNQ